MIKITASRDDDLCETSWTLTISDDEFKGVSRNPRLAEALKKTSDVNSVSPATMLTALSSLLRQIENK